MSYPTFSSRLQQANQVMVERAGGFLSEVVFDLGSDGPHPVQVELTALVLTGDGETFGPGAGTIYVETSMSTSADSTNFIASTVSQPVLAGIGNSFQLDSETQPTIAVALSSRYLKMVLGIFSNNNGLVYAGANNPTAQVQMDLIY